MFQAQFLGMRSRCSHWGLADCCCGCHVLGGALYACALKVSVVLVFRQFLAEQSKHTLGWLPFFFKVTCHQYLLSIARGRVLLLI